MSYSHENIEKLANMLREDLKLSVPITATKLKIAMEKELGIHLYANIYHHSTVCEIEHRDLGDYVVTYNPNWNEKQQLWNFAQALGEIILYGCYKDADKHIYNGQLTVYDINQKTEVNPADICKTRKHPIETYIKICYDKEDLADMLKAYFPPKDAEIRHLYDTPSETVLYVAHHSPNGQQKQYRLHFEINTTNKN